MGILLKHHLNNIFFGKECMEDRCIVYHINSDDEIVFIGGIWDSFAAANDGDALSEASVLGRSLFDFISEKESKHLYELLLIRIRESKKEIEFPFRCDSPDTRRYMCMKMTLLDEDMISFHSCIQKEETREPAVLLDTKLKRGDGHIKICSWCKKIKVEEDKWIEVEELAREHQPFEDLELPKLSHGICPDCLEQVLAEDL